MISDGTLHSRQHELVATRLRDASILIYGAGMLGSWTAHAMARVVRSVTIWDGGDRVEGVNLGTQAYGEGDIGELKGEALIRHIDRLGLTSVAKIFPPPVVRYSVLPDILIACADTMEARRQGAEWAAGSCLGGPPLFIDTRARGLEATIITVSGRREYQDYLAHLPSDDAIEPVPCGQNGTAFVGMFVASRVASLANIFCREGNAHTIPRRETWMVERGQPIEVDYRRG